MASFEPPRPPGDGAGRAAAGRELPLRGLSVVSLAEQYPGPFATLLFADLGADVVLVERPAGGDPSRQFPGFHESLNRNKRSVAVDLKRPEGVAVVERLAAGADVFLEGFRPGTLDRLGLGHERLRAQNPRLVYASISGFGQSGPYRDRPAHDLSYQAIAGLLAGQGPDDRVPDVFVGDLSAGMFAAVGVLAALVDRNASGVGRYIDVSMVDGLVSWLTTRLVPVLNDSGPAGLPLDPGYGIFRCADGRCISLSIAHEDRFWQRLCTLAGLADVADVPHVERVDRHGELRARLAEAVARRPLGAWSELLAAEDIPFGPVNDLAAVALDPHVAARGLIVELAGGGQGQGEPRQFVRQPLSFDGSAPGPSRPSPRLGEATRDVLRRVGYGDAAIDELIASGAVVEAQQELA